MADTLAAAAGTAVFEERTLRLHGPLDRDAVSPLLIGALSPSIRAHVFELYWADLSKSKPTLLSILAQLLRLAPRLLLIGRQGLRDARSDRASGALLVSRLYDAVTFMMSWALPLLNAGVILVTAAASIAFVLPTHAQPIAAIVALGLLSLAAASWIAFRWIVSLAPRSTLIVSLLLAAMLFFGGLAFAAAIWGSHWKSLLLFSEVLIGAAALVGIASHRLAGVRRSLWYVTLPLLFVAAWAILVVTLSSASAAKVDYLALREVTHPLLWLVAGSWLLMLCLAVALWVVSYRITLSDSRARRAVWTARWAFATSFSAAVLAQTFLLAVLRECAGGAYAQFFPAASFAHFVFDALKLAWPLTTFTLLVVLLLIAVWSLAPSLLAEMHGQPSATNEQEKSAQLGLWLTSGRGILSTTVVLLSLPLVFGGPVLAFSSYFVDPLQDVLEWSDDAFWAMALPASLAALAGLLRSPSGLKRIWPALGIVLDVDTYLREKNGSRQPILNRGLLLCQVLENGAAVTGATYSKIVFVAHSQGTLIAVDLVRAGTDRLKATGVPISLVTMGSPIRALYAALLPYEMEWFLDAADGKSTYNLGLTHWRNLFFAGDYIGRSLWRKDEDEATYTDAYENKQAHLSEACLGPGAHMQYWSSLGVGREVLLEMGDVNARPRRGDSCLE